MKFQFLHNKSYFNSNIKTDLSIKRSFDIKRSYFALLKLCNSKSSMKRDFNCLRPTSLARVISFVFRNKEKNEMVTSLSQQPADIQSIVSFVVWNRRTINFERKRQAASVCRWLFMDTISGFVDVLSIIRRFMGTSTEKVIFCRKEGENNFRRFGKISWCY